GHSPEAYGVRLARKCPRAAEYHPARNRVGGGRPDTPLPRRDRSSRCPSRRRGARIPSGPCPGSRNLRAYLRRAAPAQAPGQRHSRGSRRTEGPACFRSVDQEAQHRPPALLILAHRGPVGHSRPTPRHLDPTLSSRRTLLSPLMLSSTSLTSSGTSASL